MSDVDEFRSRLDDHRARLVLATERHEFVDLDTAHELHTWLHRELDRWSSLSERQRSILSHAIDYLTRVDDEEDDVASPIGLDDDREVVEAAVRAIRQG